MRISINQNQPILEVRTQKGIKLISIKKIQYVKAFRKGSIIYLDNMESIETNYLLKSYLKYLPTPFFFRCHHSFLINCLFVDCFCSKEVILKKNIRIPLSRTNRKTIKKVLIEIQLSPSV